MESTPTGILLLAGPCALFLGALIARLRTGASHPERLQGLRWAALFALFCSVVLAATFVSGLSAVPSIRLGLGPLAVSARADVLGVALSLMISLIGVVLIEYSRDYLEGDPRQTSFVASLAVTLGAVNLLVVANGLVHLVLGWIVSSLCVYRLLLFNAQRPAARAAANKKLLVARFGDITLVSACVLLVHEFGTSEISEIVALARSLDGGASTELQAAAVLLAITAALKCAQYPFHGWLPEVMETPTPVSALLHAGIVNGGGYLILRFADVMLAAPVGLAVLAWVGASSAVLASLVMVTREDVKGRLAYSTVAQMGLMLFECGLGAFELAALHLVAHSLYKAHAFLTAGSEVERVGGERVQLSEAMRGGKVLVAASALSLGVFASCAALLGAEPLASVHHWVLGGVVVLASTRLVVLRLDPDEPLRSATAGAAMALAVTASYFALEHASELVFADLASKGVSVGVGSLVAGVVGLGAMSLLTAWDVARPAVPVAWMRRGRVLLRNDFYLPTLVDRAMGSYRLPAIGRGRSVAARGRAMELGLEEYAR